MNDTVSFCVRYVDTGPHPHPSSCVASNICSHGRDMDQASVHIYSHGRDMLHCVMLQPCVQLEKSEHPHPNLDCLSSTYPGIKNPRGLSHGRAGPRAPAGHTHTAHTPAGSARARGPGPLEHPTRFPPKPAQVERPWWPRQRGTSEQQYLRLLAMLERPC